MTLLGYMRWADYYYSSYQLEALETGFLSLMTKRDMLYYLHYTYINSSFEAGWQVRYDTNAYDY